MIISIAFYNSNISISRKRFWFTNNSMCQKIFECFTINIWVSYNFLLTTLFVIRLAHRLPAAVYAGIFQNFLIFFFFCLFHLFDFCLKTSIISSFFLLQLFHYTLSLYLIILIHLFTSKKIQFFFVCFEFF